MSQKNNGISAERLLPDRKMIGILSVFCLLGLCMVMIIMMAVNTFTGLRGYSNLQIYSSFIHQNATTNLTQYLNTGKAEYFKLFEKAVADIRAKEELRKELLSSQINYDKVNDLFLSMDTHPQDVSVMITTFRRFHKVGHFTNAVQLWENSTQEAEVFEALGYEIRNRLTGDLGLTPEEHSMYLSKIQESDSLQKSYLNQMSYNLSNGTMLLNRITTWVSVTVGFILVMTGLWLAFRFLNSLKVWERMITSSEQRYKSLFEYNPDAVFSFDLSGNFMSANPILGIMLESSVEEILNNNFDSFIAPEDYEKVLNHYNEAKLGNHQNFNCNIITAKGNQLVVNVTNLPIVVDGEIIGVYGIAKDVTAKLQADKELRLSKERYDMVARSTGDIIYDWDILTNHLHWNGDQGADHAIESYNLGNNFSDWESGIHPDDVLTIETSLKETIHSSDISEWTEEYRLKKKDGTYGTILDRGYILRDDDGKPVRMIGALQDITDRKNHEIEREQLIVELTQSNNDLKQFSYITSHNLRSPLSNLIGLLDLIEYLDIKDSELKEILAGFKTSTYLLQTTIDDLTRILTIKDSKSIDIHALKIEDIFKNVLFQTNHMIQKCEPDIQYDFTEAPEIMFNKTYLESILLNLLTNALKYHSTLRSPQIVVRTKNTNDYVMLHFMDNGMGFDLKRHKDRVFGLYQRFHDQQDGKGMGLYLIKSQMDKMGGTITVNSTVEVGTEFILGFRKVV